MKVIRTPSKDRFVLIEMRESDAVLLKRMLGRVTGLNYDEWCEGTGIDRQELLEMVDDLFGILISEFGKNPEIY